MIRRRKFITLLGGASAWPLAASAQQALPVIGFLDPRSPDATADLVSAFRQGLKDIGYAEPETVTIEFRWAQGRYDRLPALVSELVGRPVAVIVTAGGAPSVLAAKAATTTIPIVYVAGGDPIAMGLVASVNRPGGNVTGVNMFTVMLSGKRLGLLRELVPGSALIAVLLNPENPRNFETQQKEVKDASRTVGQQIHIVSASTEPELDAAFASLRELRAGALLVGADPFFYSRRDRVVMLAARYAIPAMYEHRDFTVAGGLMSYGTNFTDSYRQAGRYAGRVLRGEKPGDLPVVQATKFELLINLKTAHNLALSVPNSMQLLADEVIE
jgi:putative tryptophan/tyrosine transport system substrate-binding protein